MSARIGVIVCAVGCTLAAIPAVQGSVIHASRVEHFTQGLQADGLPVSGDRSNPSQSLGAPQGGDTLNFVSLGFGGVIVLGFDQAFTSYVQVIETTYNNPALHPEFAEISVGIGETWDTATYFSLGVLHNAADDASMPLDPANSASGFGTYNFLKIVDRSDRSLLPGNADGFDVDGVSGFLTAPAPGGAAAALIGLGFSGVRRSRRRSN